MMLMIVMVGVPVYCQNACTKHYISIPSSHFSSIRLENVWQVKEKSRPGGFIFSFLIAGEVEHLFINLLTIRISFW